MQPCQQSHCSISLSKKERISRSSPRNKKSILPSKTNGNKNPLRKPPSQRFPPRLQPKKIPFLVRQRRQRCATTGIFHCRTAKPRTTLADKSHYDSAKQKYPTKTSLSPHKEKKRAERQIDNDKSAQRRHCAFVPGPHLESLPTNPPFPSKCNSYILFAGGKCGAIF